MLYWRFVLIRIGSCFISYNYLYNYDVDSKIFIILNIFFNIRFAYFFNFVQCIYNARWRKVNRIAPHAILVSIKIDCIIF